MKAPFPIDPVLTGIAIAYRNLTLIADSVFPRVPVGKSDFKYWTFPIGTFLTVPNTLVGRKGKPNEVEMGATESTASTANYGLDDVVPQEDIDNAPQGYNPLGSAVEFTTSLVDLDREVRAATLAFDTNQYGAANKTTLVGIQQWSDFANSTPISDIMTALDSMVMRANVAVFGRPVFTKLIQHPTIVKAFNGNDGGSGVATREFLARLFELEEVLVGDAWVNTAKPGQAPTVTRAWGKSAAFVHRNRLANTQRGATYGYTAQFGSRVAGQIPEPNVGLLGGVRVRSGESVKEVITANDLGYLFSAAVA